MKTVMAYIAVVFAALIIILGLTWIIQGNSFFLYKFWAPKKAEVQREVFMETPSYVQGMAQELQNMQFEYEQAKPEHKAALADLILRRAAAIDNSLLPLDLQAFINQLKAEKSKPKY